MLADMVLVVIVNWGFGIGCCCRLFDEMGDSRAISCVQGRR